MALPPLALGALEALPVFPLPGTVLFPSTILPLHVFEPRYLAMVNDALENDRTLAIVMLKEDADAMEERAEVHEVACAGSLVHAEQLPDAGYNILVHGAQRVRLVDELPLQNGYRRFRAEKIPRPDQRAIEAASEELAKLQSSMLALRTSVANTDEQLVEVMRATDDPIELCDILCAVLISDCHQRQRLLAEASLQRRLRQLIDAVVETMVRVGEVPVESKMN